ncbi:hypothetical protein C2W62_01045 [Candidatus Entotheonella serta]|nr:hypothetical protein C2W62_01045 [Candidatus Entotheonella serta]
MNHRASGLFTRAQRGVTTRWNPAHIGDTVQHPPHDILIASCGPQGACIGMIAFQPFLRYDLLPEGWEVFLIRHQVETLKSVGINLAGVVVWGIVLIRIAGVFLE